MDKLKPCPFCGGLARPLVVGDPYPYPSNVEIECQSCRACGPTADGATLAIDLWNQRQSEPDNCPNCGFKDRVCAECGEPDTRKMPT